MRKTLIMVLLSGSLTFQHQSWGEERGIVGERLALRLPNTQGNWAVIVGVDRFEDQGVRALSYAVADASAVAGELTKADGLIPKDQLYLHISGGEFEPTRGNVLESIKFVVEHAPPDGLVLVYLSSHGFLDEQKRSYVMPKDGRLRLLEDTALSVARIQELLSPAYCKASKRLLVVDACRDEPLQSGRGGGEEVSSSFTEQLRQARGQVTMVSCGPGEVSYEDERLGHGVYSYYFLQGLRGGAGRDHQGFITVSTLSDYISQSVETWCKQNRKSPFQTPWIVSEMTRSIPLACTRPASLPPAALITQSQGPTTMEIAGQSEMGGRIQRGKTEPPNPQHGDEWEWQLPDGSVYPLCFVPAGRFTMGTAQLEISKIPEWLKSNFNLPMGEVGKKVLEWEYPQHEVEVPAYWIGKYEVTVSQFRAFVEAKGYKTEAEKYGGSFAWNPSENSGVRKIHATWRNPGFVQGDSHPVVCVSWNDAKGFMEWAGLHLPTEAEWEKAARGIDSRRFPWGEMNPDGSQCNFADLHHMLKKSFISADDGYAKTAPVGTYPKGRSPYGCHDMAGNVTEWCEDERHESYEGAPADGSAWLTGKYDARMLRGGSWNGNPSDIRCTTRIGLSPTFRCGAIGFRGAWRAKAF